MSNLKINKLIVNDQTVFDITDTTAVKEDVKMNKYFYLSSGEKANGTASTGGMTNLQSKSCEYWNNGTYQIEADGGYDGLGQVEVIVKIPTYTGEVESQGGE